MELSTKHPREQVFTYADFRGGLNTTDAVESIAENELAVSVNVEIDKGTGLLRTIFGADRVCYDANKSFSSVTYDKPSESFLLSDTSGQLYMLEKRYTVNPDGTTVPRPVGRLSGGNAHFAAWEDGTLVASGGKLQYFHNRALETLSESPDKCNGVFVRDGRIWTWANDRITMSAVGDERGWTTDLDDASSAQWVDIGYKDAGNIVGIVSLTTDAVVFKDNGHVYRLVGQFPDWQVLEVGRQIEINNADCCVSVGNGVLVLGGKMLRAITTTNDYGDMKAQSIGEKVAPNLSAMTGSIRLRYVPAENSVWIMEWGKPQILVYDVALGAFFYRQYNSETRDVVCVGMDVYPLRVNSFCHIGKNYEMQDEGKPLAWEFQGKTLTCMNYWLLKRLMADTTPFFTNYVEQRFWVGDVMVYGSVPSTAKYVYKNNGTLWKNKSWCKSTLLSSPITDLSEYEKKFNRFLPGNHSYINSLKMYRSECRCVDRRRSLPVRAEGAGGFTLFNRISFLAVEV